MPKDNEVDEKAENWDYCRDLRIAVTDGKNGARATLNGYGAPAGISLYHGDYVAELKAETAASAATVAELRAEVERLRAIESAARTYYREYCQDEADDEPDDYGRGKWTGASAKQINDAAALRDALTGAPA